MRAIRAFFALTILLVMVPVHAGADCTRLHIVGASDWCQLTYGAQPADPAYYTFGDTTGVLTLHRAGQWFIRYQSGSGTDCFSGTVADIRGVVVQSDGIQQSLMAVSIQGRNVSGTVNIDGATTSGPRSFRLELADGGSVNAPVIATEYQLNATSVVNDVNAGIRRAVRGAYVSRQGDI